LPAAWPFAPYNVRNASAASVDDLLRQLDGRSIKRFDGRAAKVYTAGIVTERMEMTRRQRFLSAIAHPQVAYLLLTLGMLGLTVELWNPGTVLPGVVGGLCLLLAFFAFQVLPVNYAGLALVLLGLSFIVAEAFVPAYGSLGIGGVIAFVVGAMILIETDVPGFGVPGSLIATLAVTSLLFLFGNCKPTGELETPVRSLRQVTRVVEQVRNDVDSQVFPFQIFREWLRQLSNQKAVPTAAPPSARS